VSRNVIKCTRVNAAPQAAPCRCAVHCSLSTWQHGLWGQGSTAKVTLFGRPARRRSNHHCKVKVLGTCVRWSFQNPLATRSYVCCLVLLLRQLDFGPWLLAGIVIIGTFIIGLLTCHIVEILCLAIPKDVRLQAGCSASVRFLAEVVAGMALHPSKLSLIHELAST
jgi:hypothetical protein